MKSKKIMSMILAVAMLAGMSVNSFASENVQESNIQNPNKSIIVTLK